MKWALKFSTKGKGAAGAGKPYPQEPGIRGVGGAAWSGGGGQRGFRSSSDGEGGGEGGDSYHDGGDLDPGQERGWISVAPPDATNDDRGGGKYEGEGGESSPNLDGEDGADHKPFTVDSTAGEKERGGGGDMDFERQQQLQQQQHGALDEDGNGQADRAQASKTTSKRSFAVDPEAPESEDADEDWDAGKADGRRAGNSRSGSQGDRSSRNDGEGSHSDHSEEEAHGTKDGRYASNPSRGRTSTDGGRKNAGYNSLSGARQGRPLNDGEGEEEQEDLAEGEDAEDEEEEEEEEQDQGEEERHHGVGRMRGGGRGGGGGGDAYNSSDRNSHDQADVDGGGDGGEQYGSGGGTDRSQQRNMPPSPPGAANSISLVGAHSAASLAARTRLTGGGVIIPEKAGVQRPEQAPVLALGQAAAEAAAALRRGPTPGSHSLPSMVLVPLEALKAHRKVPRSSDRRALVRYRDLPDRSRSFVVFVSHAWMRPHTSPSFAHPDTSSRGGEKYRLIAEAGDRIRAHLPPDVRVLLWIDYSCVDQDSTRRSKATMRGMREYMRRCDAILTVYPGDAADNGKEFLPNRFFKSCAWAGSYKSLAHYCTRGWCRLEMLLGQTEPLPQDGFMFNFLLPKKKKASGAKASVGYRPHFLYGAHQRPHNGRIDLVPRQSSRWFKKHHPGQGNFTHESDRDVIRAVLAGQKSTMAKRSAAIAARYGTDPRRGGGSAPRDRQQADDGECGRPHEYRSEKELKQEAEEGSSASGWTPADTGDFVASLRMVGAVGGTASVAATGAPGMDESSSKGDWTVITAPKDLKREAEEGSSASCSTPTDVGDFVASRVDAGVGETASVAATGASGMDESSSKGDWTAITAPKELKQEAEEGSSASCSTPADAGDIVASLRGGGGVGETASVEATGASGMDGSSTKDEAAQADEGGMETSPRETAMSCELSNREDVLTTSLGPGPVTYVSKRHAIEFELQAGSLDEELPLEMTIARDLAFVDCRTAGSAGQQCRRAPFYDDSSTEEFLAMTFVQGPEGVTFPEDKPAKLRFFLGYVDESTPAGEGSDQVAVSDEEIEHDVLQTYRPLTSPDGVEDWTTLGPYSVIFRRPLGEREVWVETPVNHFSVTANAMKTDKGGKNQSYYYGDLGGLMWRFKGRSSVPKVRFGNTTKEHYATFTCYPIVLHTEVSGESEHYAEIGAGGISLGGGRRDQHSAAGGATPAAFEKITNIVNVGTYEDCDLLCDLKQHLQMNVRVGILSNLEGVGVELTGKLQLLDSKKISGNKILVLRQPRLSMPSQFRKIDWPCDPEAICKI